MFRRQCRQLYLIPHTAGQEPKDLMQTHTDKRSPSQVKVSHREGAVIGKAHVDTQLFHFWVYHLSA